MIVPNRLPGVIWSLRKYSISRRFVRTIDDERIQIAFDGDYIELSRNDARMLAKRINQCLDGTSVEALKLRKRGTYRG